MTDVIKNFASNESGGVTVDWVFLIAGLVGLAFGVMIVVSGGVEDHSGELQASLVTATPNDNPFVGDNTDLNDSID